MSSFERVLAALAYKEPDRVPFFLLVSMHGAKELGLRIQEYFSRGDHVAEGQLKMRAKFGHDCLYTFFYAAIEVEAWGGEVIYREDGPANAGQPIIRSPTEISQMRPPVIEEVACLQKVLEATRLLRREVGSEVPIIGVVMSPFSVPVMQLGFDHYLDLIYDDPPLFELLMSVNERFCVAWANAQLAAGATAICYFDPASSATIVHRELYLKTGFPIARRTIAQIKGPVAVHLASGRAKPIVDDLCQTGAAVLGISSLDDLGEIKASVGGRTAILGNLNGIQMRHWSQEEAEAVVREAIRKAAPGGGFILSDNHGEIPWQVGEDTLLAIARAVDKWGRYPIER